MLYCHRNCQLYTQEFCFLKERESDIVCMEGRDVGENCHLNGPEISIDYTKKRVIPLKALFSDSLQARHSLFTIEISLKPKNCSL